jgi:hypothetical protein
MEAPGRHLRGAFTPPNEDHDMAGLEQIELNRYHQELVQDVQHLVKKYCRIMSWEVPELDEQEARRLIFSAFREALDQAEKG